MVETSQKSVYARSKAFSKFYPARNLVDSFYKGSLVLTVHTGRRRVGGSVD